MSTPTKPVKAPVQVIVPLDYRMLQTLADVYRGIPDDDQGDLTKLVNKLLKYYLKELP